MTHKPWDPAPADAYKESTEFLEQLRPSGPWNLVAIPPDKGTTGVTVSTQQAARNFIHKHVSKHNLYFSVNPLRAPLDKKAAKIDILAIEYMLADLDPLATETPEKAKDRYLAALSKFQPPCSALIDSGNGVQALWRLNNPIILGELVEGTNEQGKPVKLLSPADISIVDDVESRCAAIMTKLGSVAGTQNIDRVLRLPGTVNIPNAKKVKEGRIECPTKLIWFNSSIHTLDDFPAPVQLPQEEEPKQPPLKSTSTAAELFEPLPAGLKKLIAAPPYPGEDRSKTSASVVNSLRHLGHSDEQISILFKAHPKGVGERYAEGKSIIADLKNQQKKWKNGYQAPFLSTKSSLVIRASDIRPRSKDWLWEGHLLRGAQELLTGVPGLGKSQVQINFVACLTAGLPWPDKSPPGPVMSVLMLTAEDTLEQEVIPRLIAAGANLEKVLILKWIKSEGKNRQFLLNEDLDQLEKIAAEIGDVGMLTVDPITAYMGGKVDSHKATEVRSQLGPLKDFAEQTGIAVSSITHPPKSGGQKAIDQFIGSQAFIAAGRIGHICVEEFEENEDGERKATGRVLFANPKNNAHIKMETLAFKVEEVFVENDHVTGISIESPRVVWDGEVVDITADEAVATSNGMVQPKKRLKEQEGLQNIISKLLSNGPIPENQIKAAALDAGYTVNQLKTAKKKMEIRSERKADHWEWELFFTPPPS
jgi:hypothetical protein